MLTGWRLTLSKLFIIPQRYVLAVMGFFAVVNAYTMRVSLSVAITEMVQPINSSTHYDPDACEAEVSNSSSSGAVTDPDMLYHWSKTTQGLILSSFYYGYVLTHLPGGVLAEKFGGKHTLGLGILSTAFFTLITPVVIQATNGNANVLIGLRIIEGLGEGTTFPALNVLLAKWAPVGERSKIGAMVFAGSQIGTVVSNAVSGVLIKATKSWASVFYLFGGLGVLWCVLWQLLCYSDPESHPFISDKEKEFLKKELGSKAESPKRPIPWRAILTSGPVWALVVAQMGHDWGFFTMVTELPTYMKDILKYKVAENGLLSSLPYAIMYLVSIGCGWLCDWLINRKYMGITFARKLFTTIASIGPGIFIIVASYSGCDRTLAVIMFTVAMGFMGTYYCGMKINALDLSPNYAGTLMAIVNGVGAITGIFTPYLAGALTEDHSLVQWRTVFWITLVVFAITNLIYVFFATAEEQWWNNSQSNISKEDQELEHGNNEKYSVITSETKVN